MIDPEQADETAGNAVTPDAIGLVAPQLDGSGRWGAVVDHVMRGPAGGLSVACGATRGEVSTVQNNGLGDAEVILRGNVHTCRTILAAEPFVVGVFAPLAQDAYRGTNELVLTRGDRLDGLHSIVSLDGLARGLQGRPNEDARLRAQSPKAFSGITVSNGNTLVAFRYRSSLYTVWVSPTLSVVGSLSRLQTLGGEPGLPYLGTNGSEVVVVFADRPASPRRRRHDPAVEAPKYSIYAVRVAANGVPSAPMPIATDGDRLEDEFSPAIAPLPGGWLIGWSYGPREVHHDSTVDQRAYLRRLDADLAPVGVPLWLNPGNSGADGRFVTTGNRFVVAVMTGRSRDRSVMTWSGTCGPAN